MNIADSDALGVAAVLMWAGQAGLFQSLELSAPVDERLLAEELGVEPLALGRVLDVLVAAGVIERTAEGVAYSPVWALLCSRWPHGVSGQFDIWKGLADYLNGEPGPLAHQGSRSRYYQVTAHRMEGLFQAAADQLAQKLSIGPQSVIIDVGAGTGVWGKALQRSQRADRLVVLDVPDVVGNPGCDRAFAVAATATQLPFRNETADVSVLANVLHVLDEKEGSQALREAARVTRVGGSVCVIDAFVHTMEPTVAEAVYNLGLGIRGGGLPNEEKVSEIMKSFGATSKVELDISPSRKLLRAMVFGLGR